MDNKDSAKVHSVSTIQQFEPYEERAAILGELHARPFEKVTVPRRVFLMAFLTTKEDAVLDRNNIKQLAVAQGMPPPSETSNFHSLTIGKWNFRWEQHNEFTTYRWDIEDEETSEFHGDDGARLLSELAFQPPGKLIVATQLKVTKDTHPVSDYEKIFNPNSLCMINTDRGKSRVVTDFQVDTMGFTKFIIEDHGMSEFRAGALVQRVLEVETYRTLALLGLPVAKSALPFVNRTQDGLAQLTAEIAAAETIEDNHKLLHKLTNLAAKLEAQAAATSFRFGASVAYNDIVMERLQAMHETSVDGARRFSSFFKRRLSPAISTCSMVEQRQTALSRKLMRTAELLRTRIQFELEQQNRDLLESMNKRARLQLRLQQTVEGLSVAAVSYYIVGLIKYMTEGLYKSDLTFGISPTLLTAISVPFVIFAMWMVTRQIHKKFAEHD